MEHFEKNFIEKINITLKTEKIIYICILLDTLLNDNY